jgi:hypothetical protein
MSALARTRIDQQVLANKKMRGFVSTGMPIWVRELSGWQIEVSRVPSGMAEDLKGVLP